MTINVNALQSEMVRLAIHLLPPHLQQRVEHPGDDLRSIIEAMAAATALTLQHFQVSYKEEK